MIPDGPPDPNTCAACLYEAESPLEVYAIGRKQIEYRLCYFCANTTVGDGAGFPEQQDAEWRGMAHTNLVANLLLRELK